MQHPQCGLYVPILASSASTCSALGMPEVEGMLIAGAARADNPRKHSDTEASKLIRDSNVLFSILNIFLTRFDAEIVFWANRTPSYLCGKS